MGGMNLRSRPVPRAGGFALHVGFHVGVIFAMLVPVIVLAVIPKAAPGFEELGPLLISIIAGIRFAQIVADNQRRPFEMVVWSFTYVFLGIAPLVQFRLRVDPGTTPGLRHELIAEASLIVLTGCAAFMVGVALSTISWKGGRASRRGHGVNVQCRRKSVSVTRTYILSFASLAIFAYYASAVGYTNLLIPRNDFSVVKDIVWPDKTTNALVTAAASMGLLVSMIALLSVRAQQGLANQRRPMILPLIVFFCLVVCVNPISTPRYVVGTAALAFLAAAGIYTSLTRFRAASVGLITSLVFIFPGADAFRNSLDSAVEVSNPLLSLTGGDFDAFAQVVNTVEYVETEGITWGKQALGVIFFWVPRSIWPDKSFDTGTLLADMKGYWFKNLSAPLWAEFFINGGWLLLIIGMLVFGVAVRRWDFGLERRVLSTGIPGLLACILPFYMLIVLRGSLLQSVAYMSVILACSVFVAAKSGKSGEENLEEPEERLLGHLGGGRVRKPNF